MLLAISPANNDIANSESLKFCRQVDPLGERTVCVITKIDLYDGSSEHLQKLLNNEIVHLKLGFVLTTIAASEPEVVEILQARFPSLCLDKHFGKKPLLEKLVRLMEINVQTALPALRQNIHAHLKVL